MARAGYHSSVRSGDACHTTLAITTDGTQRQLLLATCTHGLVRQQPTCGSCQVTSCDRVRCGSCLCTAWARGCTMPAVQQPQLSVRVALSVQHGLTGHATAVSVVLTTCV